MADVARVGGGDVAVIAGDAETLRDFVRLLNEFGDGAQLTRCRAHADDRGQRVAKLTRIDSGPISAHHASVSRRSGHRRHESGSVRMTGGRP